MDAPERGKPLRQVGRYAIFQEIAAGGMATVHLARLAGPAGFSRVVAAKCLHPHLFRDPEFRAMFIDEARLAARIRHPNVVPTLDIVVQNDELFLVMEYVQGEALNFLRRAAKQRKEAIPAQVCAAVMAGVLHGLHAAHEANNERGETLGIVHRDVSPQNILVGVDGVARVLDFGVAKAMQARHETRPGTVKGKSAYMAPEQIRGEELTRRADVFAASVVFWEVLTTKRLFGGATEEERIYKILNANFPPPSVLAPGLSPEVDAVVMKGLQSNPDDRYQSALEMAEAVERAIPFATQRVIGDWVQRIGAESINRRSEILKRVEVSKIISVPPISQPDTGGGKALDIELAQLEAEAAAHGSLTNFGMGVSRAPDSPWWRDKRTLVAGGTVLALVAVALFFGLRSGETSAKPTAAEPSLTTVAPAVPMPVPAVDPVASVDPLPALGPPHHATTLPAVPPAIQVKRGAPARAGKAGGRGFRPTEL